MGPGFHCSSVLLPGLPGRRGTSYTGYIWYRMDVDMPASAAGKTLRLYSPAVESEAWGWVNGRYIGHRPIRMLRIGRCRSTSR